MRVHLRFKNRQLNAPAVAGSSEAPEVAVVRQNGDVAISWTPLGATLQQSPDLVQDFEETTNQDNPQTVAPTGSSFYRVAVVPGSPADPAMWRSISEATRP